MKPSPVIRKRILVTATVVLLLCAIAGASVAYLYAAYFVDPEYTSAAVIGVNVGTMTESMAENRREFASFLTTDPELTAAVGGAISAEADDQTDRIRITVTAGDPFKAQSGAALLTRKAAEAYQQHFGAEATITIVETADLPSRPGAPDRMAYVLYGTLIGLCIGAVISLAGFLLILLGYRSRRE